MPASISNTTKTKKNNVLIWSSPLSYSLFKKASGAWWHMPVKQALGRLRKDRKVQPWAIEGDLKRP